MNFFERYPKLSLLIFIIFFLVFIDFVCAKIFIKGNIVVADIRVSHPYYHHTLRENKIFIDRWGNNFTPLITNSLGFKDKEPREVPLAPSGRRILFIGDSFTEGVAVTYEKTFVGLLEDYFMKRGVEVLNAGVVSYSVKHYFLKTKYLIDVVNLQFDELFVFIDISDIREELEYIHFAPRYKKSISDKMQDSLKPYLLRYSFLANIIPELLITQRGRAAYIQFYNERYQWVIDDEMHYEWGLYALELAEKNMTHLIRLCKQNGIGITIAVYPFKDHITSGNLVDRHSFFWKKFAATNGLGFLDLYPVFIDKQETLKNYFIENDTHWNEEGHALVADSVKLFVENRINPDKNIAP